MVRHLVEEWCGTASICPPQTLRPTPWTLAFADLPIQATAVRHRCFDFGCPSSRSIRRRRSPSFQQTKGSWSTYATASSWTTKTRSEVSSPHFMCILREPAPPACVSLADEGVVHLSHFGSRKVGLHLPLHFCFFDGMYAATRHAQRHAVCLQGHWERCDGSTSHFHAGKYIQYFGLLQHWPNYGSPPGLGP